MGVEFCIWLWRMQRIKRQQERQQSRRAKEPAQVPPSIPQKSHAVGDVQPVQ